MSVSHLFQHYGEATRALTSRHSLADRVRLARQSLGVLHTQTLPEEFRERHQDILNRLRTFDSLDEIAQENVLDDVVSMLQSICGTKEASEWV